MWEDVCEMRKEEDIFFLLRLNQFISFRSESRENIQWINKNVKIMRDPKQLSTVLIYVSTNSASRQGEPMLGFTVFRSDFNTTVLVNRPSH